MPPPSPSKQRRIRLGVRVCLSRLGGERVGYFQDGAAVRSKCKRAGEVSVLRRQSDLIACGHLLRLYRALTRHRDGDGQGHTDALPQDGPLQSDPSAGRSYAARQEQNCASRQSEGEDAGEYGAGEEENAQYPPWPAREEVSEITSHQPGPHADDRRRAALVKAIRSGYLDMAKWIMRREHGFVRDFFGPTGTRLTPVYSRLSTFPNSNANTFMDVLTACVAQDWTWGVRRIQTLVENDGSNNTPIPVAGWAAASPGDELEERRAARTVVFVVAAARAGSAPAALPWAERFLCEGRVVSVFGEGPIIRAIGGTCSLPTLEWLESKGARSCSEDVTEAAAFGNLPVLEHLLAVQGEMRAEPVDAAIRAVQGGYTHCVAVLYPHLAKVTHILLMDVAARAGQLDVLRWLHTRQCTESTGTDQRDRTSGSRTNFRLTERSGSLLLAHHLGRTTTSSALDAAIGAGHAEVVEFLLQQQLCDVTEATHALATHAEPRLARLLNKHSRRRHQPRDKRQS